MNHNFDCEATASMLDSGRVAVVASHVAALIAALTFPNARLLSGGALLLWPVACYFGLRVAIDASLFRAMARDPEPSASALDAFLLSQGLARTVAPRSIEARIGAALGLWRRLVSVTALQILCVLFAKGTA